MRRDRFFRGMGVSPMHLGLHCGSTRRMGETPMPRKQSRAWWMAIVTLWFTSVVHGAGNLLPNASLEEPGLPRGFTSLNVWGAKGEFEIDEIEAHSGRRSFRISATESTQSFLYGPPISVAAGEMIEASAWVKFRNVPR